MDSILEFLHAVENLKHELRHSYLSTGRRESVAEHTWRLGLMAMTLLPEVKKKLDQEKCLKMSIVHDLCEVFAGDIYKLDVDKCKGKEERERKAMKKLLKMVKSGQLRKDLHDLWEEFEEVKTKEARFVKLLDKLEVLIQHNEAPIETWDVTEKKHHYGMAKKHAEKYGFLVDFASEIDEEIRKKLEGAGFKPKEINQEDYDKFFGK